jgi:hypothetical protein
VEIARSAQEELATRVSTEQLARPSSVNVYRAEPDGKRQRRRRLSGLGGLRRATGLRGARNTRPASSSGSFLGSPLKAGREGGRRFE